MKRALIIAMTLLVIVAGSFVFVRHRRRTAYEQVEQARREAEYRNALVPFERDLRVGATRAEVQNYLDSHTVKYNLTYCGSRSSDGWSYAINIGEEPGNSFACDRWSVYIALDFMSAAKARGDEPSPSDVLKAISIRRIGHCL